MGEQRAQLPETAELGVGNSDSINSTAIESVFSGGGEMGALMRTLDWSQTAVGPVSNWPQSLKTAVRIILTSRYAMFVWWGRELVNLYNDPYRAFLGIKHPAALGKSAREVWVEIWDQIGPRTDAVLLHGKSTYDEALLLLMARHGYLEETYFTFAYSPLPDDKGKERAMQSFVNQISWQFPDLAAPLTAQISDVNQRNSAIENVGRQWLQVDPKSAEAWLAQTSLPDDRKARLLKNR